MKRTIDWLAIIALGFLVGFVPGYVEARARPPYVVSGSGSSTPDNMVTTNTVQEITAAKTLSALLTSTVPSGCAITIPANVRICDADGRYFFFSGTTGSLAYASGDIEPIAGRIKSRNASGGFTFGVAGTEYFGMAAGSNIVTVQSSGLLRVLNTQNVGTITLAAGTGTAALGQAGQICVCTDTTANASVRCAVSGTTLTATGTGTDVIAYHCF